MIRVLLAALLTGLLAGCGSSSGSDAGSPTGLEESLQPTPKKMAIKVYFADDLTSEASIVQPFSSWYLGLDSGEANLSSIYQRGAKLLAAVKAASWSATNAQTWIFIEEPANE